MLKSDQNGIEIFEVWSGGDMSIKQVKIRPKWDWNSFFKEFDVDDEYVKIRPKWDWNYDLNKKIETRYRLKSDQNGIEISITTLETVQL